MKFLVSFAALVSVALAQNAGIGYPTEGQKLEAGSDTVVQIQRPVCVKNDSTANHSSVEVANLTIRIP